MPAYKVAFLPSAEKDLADIGEPDRTRVVTAILSLADNPRPAGVAKMEGYRNLYRIRVGRYRIAYEIQDKILLVIVTAAADRGKIYNLLKRR